MAMPSWLSGGLRTLGTHGGEIGTAIGAFGGPAGMAIGNILGRLGGAGLGALLGSDEEAQQQSPLQQAQQGYLQQLQQPIQGFNLGGLQGLLRQQYQQEIVPELANRFAGMGGLRSSGFREALMGGAQNIGQQLGMIAPQLHQQQQQLNLGRLGQLGGYLTGQQQIGSAQRTAQAQAQQQGSQNFFNLINNIMQAQQQAAQGNVEAQQRAQQEQRLGSTKETVIS